MLVKGESIRQLRSQNLASSLSGASHVYLGTVKKIVSWLSMINPLGLELRRHSLHQELGHFHVH